MHRNSYNSKWQHDQPHKRIKNQGQQRHRPAENEKNTPQNKRGHDCLPLLITSEPAWKFPQLHTHLTANAAQWTPAPRHPAAYLHLPLPTAALFPARESTPKCALATGAIATKAKLAGPSAAPNQSAAAIHRCLRRSKQIPIPAPHRASSFHSRSPSGSLFLPPSSGPPYSTPAISAGPLPQVPRESCALLRPVRRDACWIYR